MQTWTELALRARDGNSKDLEEFVELAYGPTRRLCATLVDEESADDLVQETFLRMAKAIRRFRGESSARTWLYSIAHHVCASELRTKIRRREHTQLTADIDLTQWALAQDEAAEVEEHDLLRHLNPERRAAFFLTQLCGFSYEETAAICQCASGTVGSRVARARDDLIRIMNAEDQPTVVQTDSGEHFAPAPPADSGAV